MSGASTDLSRNHLNRRCFSLEKDQGSGVRLRLPITLMTSSVDVASAVLTRRLKVLGLAVCGVLIFMLVAGQLVALHLLALQDRDAFIVDFARRQRRLCEALGTSALFMQGTTSVPRRTQYVGEFQSALSLLERSVQEFQRRELAGELPGDEERPLALLLKDIASHYQSLVAAASVLLTEAVQSDASSTVLAPLFGNFAIERETFLRSLDDLVARHEQSVKASRNGLRIGGLLWRGIALVGMCWVGFLVFRPILQKVTEQTEALTRIRDELKAEIVERDRVADALRKSEEGFRTLATASPVGIFQTDVSGAGTFTNPRWQEIAGVEEQETWGMGWAEVISPEDRETVKAKWEICARQGREYAGEFRLLRPDGQTCWVSSRAVPICSESNEVLGYVGTMEDITEQKEAKEALQQAKEVAEANSKAKSEFLANMSHELRTPMNGVIGMTNLLLDSDLSPEQRDLAETAKSSAEALLLILNDVLDFSKIEAGQLALDPFPFALRTLLDGVVKTFILQAAEKNIGLRGLVSPDVPELFVGDSGRIRQILINLIGNALKFTDQGEVQVEVRKADRRKWTVEEGDVVGMRSPPASAYYLLEFIVRDTGIGISREKQSAIFDAFVQADSSTTRKYGGSGLGLSICRKLTELMGGEIWVESEVKQGSAFHFTIRLKIAEETAEVVKESSVQEPGRTNQITGTLERKRILLVEDNAVNQKLAVHLLRKLGCEVIVAHHGKEALLMLERQGPFDALLMDCQMPEMDGFEATAAIRVREQRGGGNQCAGEKGQLEMRSPAGELTTERRGFIRLPIIAMTANAMNGDRERCLSSGMDDYIAKPIRAAELQSVLERWLLAVPFEHSNARVVGEQSYI